MKEEKIYIHIISQRKRQYVTQNKNERVNNLIEEINKKEIKKK